MQNIANHQGNANQNTMRYHLILFRKKKTKMKSIGKCWSFNGPETGGPESKREKDRKKEQKGRKKERKTWGPKL